MSSFNYEKALSLEWNGQIFVLTVRKETNVGADYLYSYDGSTWTSSLDISNSSVLTTKSAYNTKWTGSNYAIIGNLSTSSGNTLLRSADGIKFSSIPSNPGIPLYDLEVNLEYPHTITFPRNTTLALGGASGDTTKIAYSIDEGVTWTPSINSSTVFNTTVNNALWNGKVWVAVGATTNTIATSVDGNTWIGRGSYIFTTSGYAIAWSNEQVQWVAGGSGTNSIAYSPDGVYWTGIGNTLLSTVYDIKWNGSIWIAAGVPISGNKSLAYSYDGKSWSLPTQTNLFDIKASKIGWNGSFWIAVGNSTSADGSYNIATSNDGIVWNMNYNSSFGLNTNIYNLFSTPKTNISMISIYNNVPSAPTNLSSISSLTSLAISFTPPSQTVDYYTITAVPTSGATVTNTFNSPATSYTITGLQSGVTYTVSLTATNSFGTSAAGTITAITGNPPSAPTNLTVSSYTDTTISISFTQPSGTITNYSISAIPSSGTTVTQTFNPPATTYTITGLQISTIYTLSLTAINIYGSSSAATINTSTNINSPTNLAVSTVTGNSISISFTQPSGTFPNYIVSAIPFSGTTVTNTFNAPTTTYTITGLSDNDYTLSLSAKNNYVTSSPVNISRIHLANLSSYTITRYVINLSVVYNHYIYSIRCNSNGDIAYWLSGLGNYGNKNVYRTTNGGANWFSTSIPSNNIYSTRESIQCNSVGNIVVACGSNNGIYISTNYGNNWQFKNILSSGTFTSDCCAINSSGTIMLVGFSPDGIVYKSTDTGVNWVSTSLPNKNWSSLAMNSTGNICIAVAYNTPGVLYVSTNTGVTWTQRLSLPESPMTCCRMNSDGTKMIATAKKVHISTDTGVTWTSPNMSAIGLFENCSSNSDGTKLAVSASDNVRFWTSSNSGINWTSQSSTVIGLESPTIYSCCMNSTGTKIYFGDYARYTGNYYICTATVL